MLHANQQNDDSYTQLWSNFLKLSLSYTSSRGAAFATDFIANMLLARRFPSFLAAASLVGSTQTAIIGTSRAALAAVSVYSGSAVGRKDQNEMRAVFKNGLIYAAINGALALPVVLSINPIFNSVLRQPESISSVAGEFFSGLSWGLPASFGVTAMQQFFLSIAKPNYAVFTTVLSAGLTLGIGYPLISLSDIGVAGMGHAYSIAAWLTLFSTFAMIKLRQDLSELKILEPLANTKINFPLLKDMAKFGSFNAIQIGTELASSIALATMLGELDQNSLESASIVLQYITFAQVPLFSMSIVASSLISKAIGANQFHAAYKYGQLGLLSELIYAAFILILFSAIPKQLSAAFISNSDQSQVLDIVAIPFILAGIGQVFDGFKNMGCGNLAGYKINKIASAVSLLMALEITGVAALFTFEFGMGVNGIFGARLSGLAISSLILLISWYAVANKQIKQSQNNPSVQMEASATVFRDASEDNSSGRAQPEILAPLLANEQS